MKPNLFRVSFDAPFLPRDIRRVRVAALLLGLCGTGIIVSGALALLQMNSETIGEFTNAKPDQNVRVVGTPVEGGMPCEEQTWPYLEPRCLKQADPKAAGRSTPKHGLGSQNVALPSAPAAEPKSEAPAREPSTTGSAPVESSNANAAASPRQSEPWRSAFDRAGSALGTEAARQRQDAKPGRSAREARQERARLQRDRREAARKVREERLRARAEARGSKRPARRDDEGGQEHQTEYSYRLPDGSSRRVIVIRPGSLDDDF